MDKITLFWTNVILSWSKNIFSGQMDGALDCKMHIWRFESKFSHIFKTNTWNLNFYINADSKSTYLPIFGIATKLPFYDYSNSYGQVTNKNYILFSKLGTFFYASILISIIFYQKNPLRMFIRIQKSIEFCLKHCKFTKPSSHYLLRTLVSKPRQVLHSQTNDD